MGRDAATKSKADAHVAALLSVQRVGIMHLLARKLGSGAAPTSNPEYHRIKYYWDGGPHKATVRVQGGTLDNAGGWNLCVYLLTPVFDYASTSGFPLASLPVVRAFAADVFSTQGDQQEVHVLMRHDEADTRVHVHLFTAALKGTVTFSFATERKQEPDGGASVATAETTAL